MGIRNSPKSKSSPKDWAVGGLEASSSPVGQKGKSNPADGGLKVIWDLYSQYFSGKAQQLSVPSVMVRA